MSRYAVTPIKIKIKQSVDMGLLLREREKKKHTNQPRNCTNDPRIKTFLLLVMNRYEVKLGPIILPAHRQVFLVRANKERAVMPTSMISLSRGHNCCEPSGV